jgi:hypothetical protein
MLPALLFALGLLSASRAAAQLTPPGLGDANTAAWQALGVRQSLDSARRRESMTYVGVGTTSTRQDYNPYSRYDIFVLNEELYDQFHPNWLYSIGLSYRRQNAYESEGRDWERNEVHELRLYGRFSSTLSHRQLKFVNTLRPELRGFVTPDFGASERPFQFRARAKSQVTWTLDKHQLHRLIGAAEVLSTVSRVRDGGNARWTDFGYSESRLSLSFTR